MIIGFILRPKKDKKKLKEEAAAKAKAKAAVKGKGEKEKFYGDTSKPVDEDGDFLQDSNLYGSKGAKAELYKDGEKKKKDKDKIESWDDY